MKAKLKKVAVLAIALGLRYNRGNVKEDIRHSPRCAFSPRKFFSGYHLWN
ncbi:MAG: hypothetical protein HY741_14975 [Chloroflexi bacterium]|nr:hypothetical protein [Chloroflexota bacterium]